jgi:hypothetical protein
MIVKPKVVEPQENQMTATVILNIVFAVFVVVAMLSLLGGAIIADHRARARLGLTAWSARSFPRPNKPRSRRHAGGHLADRVAGSAPAPRSSSMTWRERSEGRPSSS